MSPAKWKGIQRLAYLFFILACMHALLMLVPSALGGGEAAAEGVLAYSVLLVVYVVLRGIRALVDRRSAFASKEA